MTTAVVVTCPDFCIANPDEPLTLHFGDLHLFDDLDGGKLALSVSHDSVSGRTGVTVAGREVSLITAARIANRLETLAGQGLDVVEAGR